MPMPRKPDPIKHCEHCGKLLARKRIPSGALESLLHFGRRKFCDQKCMAAAFDARPTSGTSWATTHHHARKEVPPGPCSVCGKPDASDVHHKDGNHQNGSRSNLVRICRSCHIKEHRQRGSCSVCGAPVKGLGFCEKHYQRFKRHGDPNVVKVNQHR
ncbi:HNH endonuclease signature motif containing protein [Phenylobacterium sp. VNQ135]|uniref:HNH endonuclease signature motif containing protein n=1 Tax=Phenylobacterium sp. VNQ135 TaxID=3400922 RepID=UPI003C04D311